MLVIFRHLEPRTVFVCHATQERISLVLFPSQSGQLKPQTEQKKKKKTAFWIRTKYLHFIKDPIQASIRQETELETESSSVTY